VSATALTAAQARYLREIAAAGFAGRTYNGRAGVVLRNLRSQGLITFTFDLIPQSSGRYAESYTAHLTDAGRARL